MPNQTRARSIDLDNPFAPLAGLCELVLIRHGESQWNLENRFTGWTDVELTPTGVEQAKQAARAAADALTAARRAAAVELGDRVTQEVQALAMPKAVVVDDHWDWSRDRRPNTPWSETVIYEAHTKGLTKLMEEVPARDRGTYAALGHPAVIRHLQRLGVTAIELMPVHQFMHDQPLIDKGLRNYWGYNTIAFFAPHNEYSSAGQGGGPHGPGGPSPMVSETADAVDCRVKPYAAADGTVAGSFYDSMIEAGRWKTSRGRTCVSFRTTDGTGPYHTSACSRGAGIEGQTWAEHRNFLFNWNATRLP